jgi:hypothetical protein
VRVISGFNKTGMTAKYAAIWEEEGAVDSSVGAKRVLHEVKGATMERTGMFINWCACHHDQHRRRKRHHHRHQHMRFAGVAFAMLATHVRGLCVLVRSGSEDGLQIPW